MRCSHLGLTNSFSPMIASWLCVIAVLLPASLTGQVIGQVTEISNITSTPIAGSGHDYLTDLSEVVNPANGSLSVRIAAPTPARRGSLIPIYAYIYDSDGQWTPQYSTTINCESNCGTGNPTNELLLYPPAPFPVYWGGQETGSELSSRPT
jgi:hypothetical protein